MLTRELKVGNRKGSTRTLEWRGNRNSSDIQERERESYIHRKGNKKYTRHRFMTVVLEIIAAGMLDDIKGLLAAAPVVGLMVDESVDVSNKQQLIYY